VCEAPLTETMKTRTKRVESDLSITPDLSITQKDRNVWVGDSRRYVASYINFVAPTNGVSHSVFPPFVDPLTVASPHGCESYQMPRLP
jgi:hypothetical protein